MKFDSPGKKAAAIAFSLVAMSVAGIFIYKYTHRPPEEGHDPREEGRHSERT